jgi:hypothetical protein
LRWARAMRPVPRRLSNTCRAYEPAARCASPRPPGGCLYIPANCSSVSPAQSVDFNLRVRGRRLETATGTLRIRSCEDERTSGMSGAWRDDFLYQSDDLGGWTGQHVWPAGEVLARLLADPAWTPHCSGKRVVELGTGTGRVGLMALALGARSVVLTDRVLGVAESNLRRNFAERCERHRCVVRRLDWGNRDLPAATARLKAEAGGSFDLIVAANLLYETASASMLAQAISWCVHVPGAWVPLCPSHIQLSALLLSAVA